MSETNQNSSKTKPSNTENIKSMEKSHLRERIEGQLAIVIEDKDSEIITIPLTLNDSNGRITLGVERKQTRQIWGAKYGHWAQTFTNPNYLPGHMIGLSVLLPINKLFVSEYQIQSKDYKNRIYLIRNILGDLVFVAKERLVYKTKYIYGTSSLVDLKLYDAFKREVMFCRKLLRFANCLSVCCMQCMQVMAQPSKQIGTVRQKCSPFSTEYSVNDAKGKTVFRLKSTKNGFCARSRIFGIYSSDAKSVGQMKPSLREDIVVTQTKEMPILSIEFNKGLHPINKSRLISAMFLIKYLYYD